MSYKKDFIKDTLVYGLGSGVRKFIGIFLLPFYTRVLTPEDYGVLSSLGTFAMLFSAFIDVGLDSGSAYYYLTSSEEKEKGQILFTLLCLRVITFVPSVIISFFSEYISVLLFGSGEYTWVVFITCITIPFSFLLSEQSQIFRYKREPMKYNYVTLVSGLLSIILGISLVVILKYGIIGAQMSSLISTAFILPCTYLLFTRKAYVYKFSLLWAKKLIIFGYPLIGASLASWVFQSSDRFFLLHYSNLTEIGWYSIGQTFSQPILLLNAAVQMGFGVLFFRIYGEENDPLKTNSKKMAVDSFNIYLCASVSISLFLSIFSVEFLSIITTKQYLKGALAIPFLCFSLICSQAYQTMGPGITIAEKNYHYTWITIATALLNTMLNFLFIPKMGFVGAALATLVSFIFYWLIKNYIAQKYFPVDYPLKKILLYFFMSLIISLSVPIFYFYCGIDIGICWKITIFLISMSLPFILKLIDFNAIMQQLCHL